MNRTAVGCGTIWFALLAGFGARAEDAPKPGLVKKLAQEIGAAMMKGDAVGVIDHTYPGVIDFIGGRDKAIQATQDAMKAIADKGFAFKSLTVDDPGKFFVEGANTFVVVPTTIEMTFPDGRVKARSYLLGISADHGKTWKFVDGSGVSRDARGRDQMLPKLPPGLKLPESSKPEIIKDA